jgi:hypothetical protein
MEIESNQEVDGLHIKRSSPRLMVIKALEMKQSATQQIVGSVFDVSEQGFMLMSDADISDNQEYEFILNLGDSSAVGSEITLKAECRWCRFFNSPGFYSAGFMITEIDPQYYSFWQKILAYLGNNKSWQSF